MKIIFAVLLIATACSAFFEPIARTRQGLLIGRKLKSRKGQTYLSFTGIPYAEPPVGELRFRNPVPKKPWFGLLNAQRYGNQCHQYNPAPASEDCLTLNVYTPRTHNFLKPLLPVMVFIHGGGYIVGNSSDKACGPEFLLDKDIVYVTMNYRLGIFGFLSTGDAAAPGNFGMKDQRLALEWVQENILAFGGDPNRVTLFGESAGGSSVSLHALSDSSKHLFNQYVMQSGNVLCPWAFRSRPSYYNHAKQVAEMRNCPTDNSWAMVDCLRRLSVSELSTTTSIFTEKEVFTNALWGPTVEPPSPEAFLTQTPEQLLQQGKQKEGWVITGNVKDEGLLVTSVLYVNEDLYKTFVEHSTLIIAETLSFYDPIRNANLTELATKLKNFYLGAEMPKDKERVIRGFTEYFTDLMFFYPQIQLMEYMRMNHATPTYFYSFGYRGTQSATKPATGTDTKYGVSHSDELIYLFPWYAVLSGVPQRGNLSSTDYKMVDQMGDLWTSFATTGIPQWPESNPPFTWTPYTSYSNHLEIGNGSDVTSRMQQIFFGERMKFWYENVPQYNLKRNY